MENRDDKLISALRLVLEAEFGIKVAQDEASILANTLTDFFEVLALIEHKKECPKKDELEKILKQKWGEKRKINMNINHHDNHD